MTIVADPISRIEKATGGTSLVGWQFAADGKWDAAERVYFEGQISQETGAVLNWLDRQAELTEDIALEALFDLPTGGRFFFGVRIVNLNSAEKKQTIRELFATCETQATDAGGSLEERVWRPKELPMLD